jgi:hypothetical protein
MPEVMYVEDAGKVPDIISLDSVLQSLVAKRETTFSTTNGNCATRVCYVITHENPADVPKGTEIKLSIMGTNNQDSVRKAGNFLVITQLYEIAD